MMSLAVFPVWLRRACGNELHPEGQTLDTYGLLISGRKWKSCQRLKGCGLCTYGISCPETDKWDPSQRMSWAQGTASTVPSSDGPTCLASRANALKRSDPEGELTNLEMMLVLLLAIVLVLIVLLFEFRTFAAPLAILSSALLSTAGVFIALIVTRTTFNISSFMGMIMVIGIVANNGILLLDADQKFRATGLSKMR
jgi:hypothetical protein